MPMTSSDAPDALDSRIRKGGSGKSMNNKSMPMNPSFPQTADTEVPVLMHMKQAAHHIGKAIAKHTKNIKPKSAKKISKKSYKGSGGVILSKMK